jgi:hypothetical protein
MSASINTIPASHYVQVNPSVISGGGLALDLIGLMLTNGKRSPIGSVLSFASAAAVVSYFGSGSVEANNAAIYFLGFNGSTKKPGSVLLTQYPTGSVGAWLRGGNISNLTLAQLQALAGVLTITIDGTPTTSSAINLSAATSFSSAAGIIGTALGITGPAAATVTGISGWAATASYSIGAGNSLNVTAISAGSINIGDIVTGTSIPVGTAIVSQTSGTPGGIGVYTISATPTGTGSAAAVTGASYYINVTAVASGAVASGDLVAGTSVASGTYIASQVSGAAGGIGLYTATLQNHVASETLTLTGPVVAYDSIAGAFTVQSSTTGASSTISFGSGTIAASLLLTQATGAILSQGAIAAVPGTFMNAVIASATDWATFLTLFDPDAGSGNAQKQLFAAWTNAQNSRYMYAVTDNDPTPTQVTNATTSLVGILNTANSSGSAVNFEPTGSTNYTSAFVAGYGASIDFDATNGRADAAFRSQSGLTPSVTSLTAASNLEANKESYYGAVATAAQGFQFLYAGNVTGPFQWIDSYLNQIWLNNACQLALMEMLTTYFSIPYNPVGYGFIRAALMDPVNAGVNNGVIRQNVPLSSAQASEVNALAGQKVDGVLSTRGWYLVIQPATSLVRQARQSPTIILLYMDGQSIQRINMSSVLVQ